MIERWRRWRARRARQRRCFHHITRFSQDVSGMDAYGASYVRVIAHTGDGRRVFECAEALGGCGELWVI